MSMGDIDGLGGLGVQNSQQTQNQMTQGHVNGNDGSSTQQQQAAGMQQQPTAADMMGQTATHGYHNAGGYHDYTQHHHHTQQQQQHHYQQQQHAYNDWGQQQQQQQYQQHNVQQQIHYQQRPQMDQYHHGGYHHTGHQDQQQQYHHQQQWATTTQHQAATQQQTVLIKVDREQKVKLKGHSDEEDGTSSQDNSGQKSKKAKASVAKRRKVPKSAKAAPKAKASHDLDEGHEPLVKASDESVDGVRAQLSNGCECAEASCFEGLCPEAVYRHRLDIDELTKPEHHMYLLGVTMACLNQKEETNRHSVRKRQKSKYRFMGRDVCLAAFLYLEHTTLHQLKMVRKHIRDHGCTPKEHGNHRKRPHNVFSLDIYQTATKFLQGYFERHSSSKESASAKKKGLIFLPDSITCKRIHSEYANHCQAQDPGTKTMGYTSFRHFVSDQFPNLRFINEEKPTVEKQLKKGGGGHH